MFERFLSAAALFLALSLAAAADAATLRDSRGEHTFSRPPGRVVVLDWALTEQILHLDVTPVAVAERNGYDTWVARPKLPDGVDSVGTRREPNLERIADLKPDLILVSDDQLGLVAKLERIAPVLHFEAFAEGHNNYLASRAIYLELAKLFGREALALERLAELDARLAALKAEVAQRFDGVPPKVTPVRFIDGARLRVHGTNSMAQYALEAIGISHGMPQPATAWGFTLKRIEDLSRVTEGYVIHIEPFPKADEVFTTRLWSFMPFVRSGRFAAIPSTWTFGGPFSVGYLAEEFAQALMKTEP